MDQRAVGHRVDERRRAMGLTGDELAKKLGCSAAHLSRVMAGKSGDMKYDTIRAWANTLEVTPSWLAEGDSPDFRDAATTLGADPIISRALATISVWFETTTEVDREIFRHSLDKWASLLNRRDTHIKEVSDRDLVVFASEASAAL